MTFQGSPVVHYPVYWTTADSSQGWAFRQAEGTNADGYSEAEWVLGPGAQQTIVAEGAGVRAPLTVLATPFETSTAGRGVWWQKASTVQADGFRVSLTAATAPQATYYAAMQCNSGYLGYQVQNAGRHNLIFTVWDAQGVTASLVDIGNAIPERS